MSGVEVIEPAFPVVRLRSAQLRAGTLSTEVVAAQRGICRRRSRASEPFERAGSSGWASAKRPEKSSRISSGMTLKHPSCIASWANPTWHSSERTQKRSAVVTMRFLWVATRMRNTSGSQRKDGA